MAALISAMVKSDGFKVPVSGVEEAMGSGEVEMFARGVLLSQDMSRKYGYEQMLALVKVAGVSQGVYRLVFLGRYFKALAETGLPMEIYQETKVCLLTKQALSFYPLESMKGRIGNKVLEAAVTAISRLLQSIQNLDSVRILKSGIEGNQAILGEEVLSALTSDDSAFLSEGNTRTPDWTKARIHHILSIIHTEIVEKRPTLLAPLLLISIKLCPSPSQYLPLLTSLFPVTAPVPTASPTTSPTTPSKPISMVAGLKWLYSKVMNEVLQGVKSDFDQVEFELHRLVSGDGIQIAKNGKQELFEAFDELMVVGKSTRETLSCWKVLVKSFGRLNLLETVEWSVLQEKLSRLADRNQYKRDIGKKKPNPAKHTPSSTKIDRKKASAKKRFQ